MTQRGPVSLGTGMKAEPRLGGLVGAGALSALLFGSAGLVPALAPLSFVSPLPLMVQRLRGGRAGAWLAASLAAALVAASSALPAAGFYLLVLAVPGLLLGESLARGRGLLKGCAWAFGALVAEIAAGLAIVPQAMAELLLAPFDQLRSEAFLAQLKAGGMPPEQVSDFTEVVGAWRGALAVVYPAVLVILAAGFVAVNAGVLRFYLLRRDPGWLEDGEFERVRWPLALTVVFVLAGAGVALPLARPVAYNVLLVTAFFFALQGLAVVAFYARRLAGPPLLRAAVVVLVLANPWAPQILALLGLFDNWFDFRHWAEPPPGAGEGTRPGRPA
jgi:uncharacterized protein YybS (DUF2232 family)